MSTAEVRTIPIAALGAQVAVRVDGANDEHVAVLAELPDDRRSVAMIARGTRPTRPHEAAVEVVQLRREYVTKGARRGSKVVKTALDDVDLRVHPGEMQRLTRYSPTPPDQCSARQQ